MEFLMRTIRTSRETTSHYNIKEETSSPCKKSRDALQTTTAIKQKLFFSVSCSISLCYVEVVYQPSHCTNQRRGKRFLLQ